MIHRVGIVLLLASAGCQTDDDDYDEGQILTIDVHADQPLDQIVVRQASTRCRDCSGPVTPTMLANGVTMPQPGIVLRGSVEVVSFAQPVTTYRFQRAEPFGFDAITQFVVLGYRRNAAGALELVAAATMLPFLYGYGEYTGTLALTSDLVPALEVWGDPDHCVAIHDGAAPRYFVDYTDQDCDGFADDDDCNIGVYCDPAATSPAARAACEATICEPCLGEIDGACTLGTQAVCHDLPGQSRSYTCETNVACGTAMCLPAGACQLPCEMPWPATDPIECLQNQWTAGAQATEALRCRLPAMATQYGNAACASGSIMEVALPFASCANAEIVSAYHGDSMWNVSITPSCTLHLELRGPEIWDSRVVLVAFDTGATTSTVRLALEAEAGTCGTIGACDPVPATATCGP